MSDVPSGLKYTKDHEWAKVDGNDFAVGITQFAVEQLGDITLVNIDVKLGDAVMAGKAFGTIESVKTLSDLFAPVSGKVVKVEPRSRDEARARQRGLLRQGLDGRHRERRGAPDLMDEKAYAEFLKNAAH